jgi:PD-(D/E)XK nuclease superfamily
MRFRQSLLKTWQGCALQAKYREIDGLPRKQGSKAAFGTVIHHALHQYEVTGGNLEMALKTFVEVWDDPAQLGVEPDVWNRYTSYGGLRQKGIEILKGYDEANRWERKQIVALEHRFLVPFGAHEIEGTVDKLDLAKNHRGNQILRVVDYKTNARQPTTAELALDVQFTTYIYATLQPEFWLGNGPDYPPVHNGDWWWSMLQSTPRRGIWVQLWANSREIDAGARDDNDFGRLYRLCNEIEKAIERDVFVPCISGDTCGLCDYANGPCPTRVPTRDEWAEQRLEAIDSWV